MTCCTLCGAQHEPNECTSMEQVQYVNYNRRSQNNPYFNTYNPGWRNNHNLGWWDRGYQQRLVNPPSFQPRPT